MARIHPRKVRPGDYAFSLLALWNSHDRYETRFIVRAVHADGKMTLETDASFRNGEELPRPRRDIIHVWAEGLDRFKRRPAPAYRVGGGLR